MEDKPSTMKAKDFRSLLKLADIKLPIGLNRDDLWRLCIDNKLVDRELITEKWFTVVKSSLIKSLNIETDQRNILIDRIDKFVSIVSKLFVRSSLALYYHVMSLGERNCIVPDFYKKDSTYWYKWLLIGFNQTFPDDESKVSFKKISSRFHDQDLEKEIKDCKYLNQVLLYAATTFSTAIENNAWFPLFSKLERLIKFQLREWNIDSKECSKFDVINAIRRPCQDTDMSIFQDNVRRYILTVKDKLFSSDNSEYIGDTHAKENLTFTQAFGFNLWMQQEFQRLDVHENIMIPVFSVHRAHVRLDVKTLTFLFMDLFPNNEHVKKYKTLRSEYLAKIQTAEDKSTAPHKQMLQTIPKVPYLKKKNCDEKAWKEYKEKVAKYQNDIKAIKGSDDYMKNQKLHERDHEDQLRMLGSFFTKLRKDKKWTFDCSIMTDGVALSRQYSRIVTREIKPAPPKAEITKVEDYNKKLSCFDKKTNTLHVGLDPGRTNLAAMGFIIVNDDGKKIKIERKGWILTRQQYYEDSGIRKRSIKKAKRYESIRKDWSELGSLRVTKSGQLLTYIDNYNIIKNKWWDLAISKVESLSKFMTYSGKARVLAGFFVKVKKEIMNLHPGINIKVAYGSAFSHMKSSGKGEQSAPVSKTYKACKEIFDTEVQDEDYTTKISWETGKETEKVYKTFVGKWIHEGKERMFEMFGHCNAKSRSPKVTDDTQRLLVDEYNESHKKKKRKPPDPKEVKPKTLHYPEIRGLRFCPETRTFVNRDVKSSLAIARLAVMRITTQTRPSVFSRPEKTQIV